MKILNLIIFSLTIQQTLTTLTDEEFEKLKTQLIEVILQECMPKSSETVIKNMKIDIEGMKPAIQSNQNTIQNEIKEGMKLKTLRSCEEIRLQGLDRDGDYPIDPDGELIGKM